MERTVIASQGALDCAATLLRSFSDRAPSSHRGELERIASALEPFDYPLQYPAFISASWPLIDQLTELADRIIPEEAYGSEEQIDASNAFAAVLERFNPQTFNESSDYAAWCLKATSLEMVQRAFVLLEPWISDAEKRDLRLWRMRQRLLTREDAALLLQEELHTEGKTPCKETCDDLQRIAEGN